LNTLVISTITIAGLAPGLIDAPRLGPADPPHLISRMTDNR
jgi:hypothetical protein